MEYQLGQSASYQRTISEEDLLQFANLSGDYNPMHISKPEIENSIFKNKICHGMLLASFISRVIGMVMPGPGAVYLGQSLKFLKPVYIGDTITVEVEIVQIRTEKVILTLRTSVVNQENALVLDEEAVVKMLTV